MKQLFLTLTAGVVLGAGTLPVHAQGMGNMPGMEGMPGMNPAPKTAPQTLATPDSNTHPGLGVQAVPPSPSRVGGFGAALKNSPGLYGIPGAAPAGERVREGIQLGGMGKMRTQSNLKPGEMPDPVMDSQKYSFTLFDILEYRPKGGDSDFRFDVEGWRGGDYRRTWFKTEGQRNTALKADYDVDFQLLSAKLVSPYTFRQYGLRIEAQKFRNANVGRPQFVYGFERLVPYNYEVETALFLDPRGNISGRFAASKDTLITQRLVLQSRLESEAAIQQVERFTQGSGLNNIELGFRLRYEIKREFAPYIGISFDRAFGRTATFVRRDGGDSSQTRLVAGVRAYF